MAISKKQRSFPEPDGPLTVFVPIRVDGVRYAFTHGEAILLGIKELSEVAERENVRLVGKPSFRMVTVPATNDRFLAGEQEVETLR